MSKPHSGSQLEEVEENILASTSAEENNYDASHRNFEVTRPYQYRRNPVPNRNDQEATWAYLKETFQHIFSSLEQGMDLKTYMGVYTAVHNFSASRNPGNEGVTGRRERSAHYRNSKTLYGNISSHIEQQVAILREASKSKSNEALLEFFVNQWQRYERAAKHINHLCRYLNRHWVRREVKEGKKNLYDVYTLHLVQWKTNMFEYLHERAMESVLSLVERQRNGEWVGYREIRKYIDSFVALNIGDPYNFDNTLGVEKYKALFEKPFCLASFRYYQQESAKFLADCSVVEYMKMAEDRLRNEEYHTSLYLLNELMGPLIQACERALILDHLDFIRGEFIILLQCDDRENLGRMYRLLSRIPGGLDPLRTQFQSHLLETGLKEVEYSLEVTDILEPSDYVAALSTTITKYESIVSEVFDQEAEFTMSFNKACQRIANRNTACENNPTKSSELLALYTNTLLMHSTPVTIREGELQVSVHKIISLFTHLEDKDAFQRFYSRMLGNRLLFTGTVNEDAERILIFHMREVCNVKLLSALQTMLQDLHISRELNSSFRDFCAGNPSTEDFSIDDSYRVLSSAKAWHLNLLDTEFTPPLAVAQRCERFIEFYKTQHKGRRLTWLWQLCRGEVLANYVHLNSKPYQFRLSAYQMAILFLFNDADEVSYEDMEISTRLVRSILVPCIESLVKLKVLSVYPPKRKPAEASFYSLNNEFQSRKIKVSLHITSKTERLLEAEDTHRAISEERRLIIKCTAVRIMKLRKQMNCRELALEVTQQLRSRFTPTTSDLKRCIEGLVETEFLTRLDEECLGYIA